MRKTKVAYSFTCTGTPPRPKSDSPFREDIWTPRFFRVSPVSDRRLIYFVWWLFHLFGIFRDRGYLAFTLSNAMGVQHRSLIFPAFFRFPFMKNGDLQIGDTFTNPQYRNLGLATMALEHIMALKWEEGRTFWYLATGNNDASRRVAEKAGFKVAGEVILVPRANSGKLGSYRWINN